MLDATHHDRWAWTDVPAQGTARVQVAFQPARRGLHPVPALTAETRFPLGIFRVWTVWRPAAQVLVIPRPNRRRRRCLRASPGPAAWPPRACRTRANSTGCRAYRRGDALKQVVWKKAAKADELVSRDNEQAQRYELWLDFARAGALGTEHRLSRLTAWVLQADRLGLDYGLRLPGRSIAPASGPAQRRQCLEALALC